MLHERDNEKEQEREKQRASDTDIHIHMRYVLNVYSRVLFMTIYTLQVLLFIIRMYTHVCNVM